MITRGHVLTALKKARAEDADFPIHLDETEENVIDERTGFVTSLDDYVQDVAKNMHCNFENVYYEHASLYHVIRCKDCGAVIFTYEDERYNPNLRCPVCSDYSTSFPYWSKEEIEADESKQAEIAALEHMQENIIKTEERRERRKGKNDNEIFKWVWTFKNSRWYIGLECENLFYSGLKGLNLSFNKFVKSEDEVLKDTFVWRKHYRIPLSIYAIYKYMYLMPKWEKKYDEKFSRHKVSEVESDS